MRNYRGIFVSVDGPNGVGKTAMVKAIAACLTRRGLSVHTTKEVTGTSLGQFIHQAQREYRGKTLALLVAADRQNHIEYDVVPALRSHDVVITDRYVASSLAFQRLDAVALSFIWKINAQFPKPNLSILLTAPPNAIERRMASRQYRDRFEASFAREAEVEVFKEAAAFMQQKGFNVLRFANVNVSIEKAAKNLSQAILSLARGNE